MSPSESELRAALRAGEGQRVSAAGVIARAQEVRHTRRKRLGAVVGAAAVVAGIGAGITYLPGSSTQNAAGSRAAPELASGAGADSAGSGAGVKSAGSSGGPASTPIPSCPAQPLSVIVPGVSAGGSLPTGPLFGAQPEALDVCGYAANRLGGPVALGGTLRLTGADATALAHSLNAASANRPTHQNCPTIVQPVHELVLYGRTASGTALAPVTVQLSVCPTVVTNGTVVRYAWQPPSSLADELTALVRPPTSLPSGSLPTVVPPTRHPSGSPPR